MWSPPTPFVKTIPTCCSSTRRPSANGGTSAGGVLLDQRYPRHLPLGDVLYKPPELNIEVATSPWAWDPPSPWERCAKA